MWLFVFLLLPIAVIVFIQMSKNGNNQNKGTSSGENSPREINSIGKLTPPADKPANPRQSQIDRDKEIAKKIFIYGGGACLVILVAGIIFALNPNKGVAEKSETIQRIGLPIVAILAVIGVGSILPNMKKKEKQKEKKVNDFYRSYFIDQYGHRHDQNDHNFLHELKLYSEYNRKYHKVELKDYEVDWYIIDGRGNAVDIRNREYIVIRDEGGNYCNLKIR